VAPQLDLDDLDEALPGDLGMGDTIDAAALKGASLGEHRASGLRMIEASLIDCDADLLETSGGAASEVLVSQCRFTTWEIGKSSLRDVSVEHSRLGALQADGADLVDVEVTGCRIDYLGLREAKLRRVTFRDCVIGSIDLSGATVEGLTITGGRVDEFQGSRLGMDADLSDTDVVLLADPSALRGLRLSDEQVALHAWNFAEHLGVRHPGD